MTTSLLRQIDWWLVKHTPYTIECKALIYKRLIIQATWHSLTSESPMILPWEDKEFGFTPITAVDD
jgi:hypothetical protein